MQHLSLDTLLHLRYECAALAPIAVRRSEDDAMTTHGHASPAMSPPDGARPATVVAMCAALQGVGGGLGWSLVPPLLPLMATDLRLDHTWAGVAWGAAPLGIALAAPIGGALVDRFGVRWTAGLGLVAGAIACAARAWAVDGATLALAMFAFGLHVGICAPAVPKALAGHVPLASLARWNGMTVLAYTLGTAATVLAARRWIVPAFGGWRGAMIFAGAAMAVTALAWMLLVRDRLARTSHAGIGAVFALARHRQLLRVGGVHFLLFGGYLALLGSLPRILGDRGLDPATVGLAVATWLATAGAANFAGPWLSDRLGARRPLILVGAVAVAVALVGLAFAPPAAAMPLLALAAVGGGCFAPLVLTLPLELPGVGPQRAGAALGLLMLLGQLGGFLLPVASGALSASAGHGAALLGLAAVHALILVPAWGLLETGRRAATVPVAATAIGATSVATP
jgi:NNP family nitrate/nitrite transporter-like MFS transporter